MKSWCGFVQHLSHLGGKSPGREGLLQEVDSLVQPSGMDDGVPRVARHVEHAQIGPENPHASNQIVALHHPGEHDVGEKEIHGPLTVLEGRHGFIGRAEAEHLVARGTEHALDEAAYRTRPPPP